MVPKDKTLQESFGEKVRMYKESLRYSKSERRALARFFYGLRVFGVPYLFHTFARFKVPVLFGDTRTRLFFGRELALPGGDIGSHALSMYGIIPHKSERRLSLWVMENLREDDIFYDIGAHLGFYTALAEHLAARGAVHAFEANETLCRYLRKNFAESGRTHVACSAVAAAAGTVDFYDATDTDDSSESSRFNISGKETRRITVPALTIDGYVAEGNTPPTVMKFDIEGGEYDAILGGIATIQRHHPRILLEVWGGELGRKYSDVAVQKLLELGYQAFTVNGDGMLAQTPVADPVGSIEDTTVGARDNFVFLPRE